MNDRLKKALDKVQAEEELKNNTKAFERTVLTIAICNIFFKAT